MNIFSKILAYIVNMKGDKFSVNTEEGEKRLFYLIQEDDEVKIKIELECLKEALRRYPIQWKEVLLYVVMQFLILFIP